MLILRIADEGDAAPSRLSIRVIRGNTALEMPIESPDVLRSIISDLEHAANSIHWRVDPESVFLIENGVEEIGK